MGVVAWFWDTLVGDAIEETDALELVLAELERGAKLPDALAYASASLRGLATGPFAAQLLSMSRGAIPRSEPWRTLDAAWRTFGNAKALASQGFALVSKLRALRALRVETATTWVSVALSFLSLAAGSVALAVWGLGFEPAMTMSFNPVTYRPVRDLPVFLGVPALGLALIGSMLAGLYFYVRGWHLLPAAGGSAPELLFFIGAGLGAGAPLPEVLRHAARACPCAGEDDREFLNALAASLESDSPPPEERPDRSAWRLLASSARHWKAGLLTAESLRFSALVLADRSRERMPGVRALLLGIGMVLLTALLPFLLVSLTGGPIGHWLVHMVLGHSELGLMPR